MATTKLTGKHNYAEFKEETVRSRVKKMTNLRDAIKDATDLHVRLSYGNRKCTALVPSVSLIPVADCGNCKLCSRGCYECVGFNLAEVLRPVQLEDCAVICPLLLTLIVAADVPDVIHRFFRWHIGGDIKDYDYFGQVVGIATRVPGCQFLIFTKMYDIVNEWIENVGELPENLHVIFSDWRGAKMRNPHGLPVSSPVWKDGTRGDSANLESGTWCPGDCSSCATTNGGCWGAKKGDTILFEAH